MIEPRTDISQSELAMHVDVVARAAIVDACDSIEWDDFPEIGEYDWDLVAQRIGEIMHYMAPSGEVFDAAFAALEARVDSDTEPSP